MKASWSGQVIADSERTQDVGGYVYFPRESVRMELLRIAEKSPSDQRCPHGVQFYDLVSSGGESERAAWSYERPGEAMAKVDHWIGFWGDDIELG